MGTDGLGFSASATQCFFVIAAWMREVVEEIGGLEGGGVYDVL
jgi:hypothetical protein